MKTSYKVNTTNEYELTISLTKDELRQLLDEFNSTWVGNLMEQIWDLAIDAYDGEKHGDQ